MTEVPPDTTVVGPDGPIPFGDVFEGRDELVVYSHMFYDGEPWEWQCEGCTRNSWPMQHAADAAGINAYGITFAILAARAVRGARGVPRVHGLHDAVVLQRPPRPPHREPQRLYRLLPAAGGEDLPDVQDDRPGRRGDEPPVRAARQDRLRAAGGVGGLARGVAAAPDPLLPAHRRARRADGAQKRRSTPVPVDAPGRHRSDRGEQAQRTAFFTSAAIFFSSAAVSSFSAKEVGHMAPSSRFASSLKPSVAYLALNLSALWKKQTTLPSSLA